MLAFQQVHLDIGRCTHNIIIKYNDTSNEDDDIDGDDDDYNNNDTNHDDHDFFFFFFSLRCFSILCYASGFYMLLFFRQMFLTRARACVCVCVLFIGIVQRK